MNNILIQKKKRLDTNITLIIVQEPNTRVINAKTYIIIINFLTIDDNDYVEIH